MSAELARRIINELTEPGDLIVDPSYRTGTLLIEAALLNRRSVGLTATTRAATQARIELDRVLSPTQRALTDIGVGDPRQLPRLLGTRTGHVDLICVAHPYRPERDNVPATGVAPRPPADAVGRHDPAGDPANDRFPRNELDDRAVTELLAAWWNTLRPGGRLVTITDNPRHVNGTVDLAGRTVTLARQAGFAYLQHVVAVHAAIREGDLDATPTFGDVARTRSFRYRGRPAHLAVHHDVCLFAKPQTATEVTDAD